MGKRLLSIMAGLFAFLGITLFGWGAVFAADNEQVRDLNREGQRLMDQARFREAIGVFTRMLRVCGDDEFCQGIAKFYLGRSHFEVSDFDLATGFLQDSGNLFSRLNRPVEKAKVLHVQGQLLAARTAYEQAVSAFDQSASVLAQQRGREDEELFGVLMDRAAAKVRLYQYDKAEKDLNEAERILKGGKEPRKTGALLHTRGLMYHQRQKYDQALTDLNEALKIYESVGDRKRQALLLTVIGHVYESRAQYNEALERYNRSLELATQVGDPATQAFGYNNLGSVNWKRGNYPAALKHYKAALEIRERLGIPRFRANQLNNIGLIYLAYGDYTEAFKLFEQSRQIAKEVGAKEVEAWALHDEAWVMKEQGRFIEALKASEQAIELAEEIRDRRLQATAILRLGNLYEHYGNFDEAGKQYQHAIKIQRDIGDSLFESNTLGDLANLLTRTGNADDIRQAEKHYQEALKVKRRIGVPLGELLCKFALFYLEQSKYYDSSDRKDTERTADLKKADALIREAEGIVKPEEREDFMLLTYVRARYLLDVEPEQAIVKFTDLQSLADTSGSLKYRFLALVGLGLANERLKRLAEAEKAYEQAVTASEDIRDTLDPEARRTFLHGEEVLGVKHLLPYEGLARVRLLIGKFPASWEAAEQAKARSFGEKLAGRIGSATYGVDKDMLERLVVLENQIASAHQELDRCKAKEGDKQRVPLLREKIDKLRTEYRRLQETIKQQAPRFHDVRFPRPIPIDKTELNSNEMVLAYKVTDNGVLVYLAHGKDIVKAVFKPIERPKLYRLIRAFRQPLKMESEDADLGKFKKKLAAFDFKASETLRDLLLVDALGEVSENQPVIIMPDDLLGIVPFEALVLSGVGKVKTDKEIPYIDPGQVKFFGDRNPVSYYQSGTALTLARRWSKDKGHGARLLAMVDPIFPGDPRAERAVKAEEKDKIGALPRDLLQRRTEGKPPVQKDKLAAEKKAKQVVELMAAEPELKLPPLHETEQLGESLQQTYGDRAEIRRGGHATKSAFVDRDLTVYWSLVFGTHGLAEGRWFPEPVIFLTYMDPSRQSDGVLGMSEVMSLKMNPDLVTLIACESGLGSNVSGEGTMSMGRAFQYGGAGSVLISLWSVHVDASVVLAESFFKSLQQRKTNLEALREARATIRNKGYEHPFFWAPFILVGEAETK
ncbi:MAG: tetratricopeptide repeat protein [Desulfomonile tiedjei]|nr:tetratricopeptide repeat protein [Desulfomonile tiedjei]